MVKKVRKVGVSRSISRERLILREYRNLTVVVKDLIHVIKCLHEALPSVPSQSAEVQNITTEMQIDPKDRDRDGEELGTGKQRANTLLASLQSNNVSCHREYVC